MAVERVEPLAGSNHGPLDLFEVRFWRRGVVPRNFYEEELSRVVFEAEARLELSDGTHVTVEQAFTDGRDGLVEYLTLGEDGVKRLVREDRVVREIVDLVEQFVAGEDSDPDRFRLYLWANYLAFAYASKTLKCVTSSRLMLLPHQVFIAHRLLGHLQPRFLLADEVGLGKTIEAGIVVKELLARSLAKRVLIVAPASLVSQWQFELANKFNEWFDVLDAKFLKRLAMRHPRAKNPIHLRDKVIVSLQFARKPRVREMLSTPWDVVVFDEAHHLRRHLTSRGTHRETLSYALARALAERTGALLLLTATPMQLHPFELYSLVDLVRPGTFKSFTEFEEFRSWLPTLNMMLAKLPKYPRLNVFERRALVSHVGEWLESRGKRRPHDEEIAAALEDPSVVDKLAKEMEREHVLAELMVRNKKRLVFEGELPRRVPRVVEVELDPEEADLYERIRLYVAKAYNEAVTRGNQGLGFVMVVLQKLLASSRYALMATLGKRIEGLAALDGDDDVQEAWSDATGGGLVPKWKRSSERVDLAAHRHVLEEFRDQLGALKRDSKLEALVDLVVGALEGDPNEKFLVFAQFRATVKAIAGALRNRGVRVTTFHGGLSLAEKDRRVEEFRTRSQVLVSTEIGGEGRNFQFCHRLVNFDLPWNPAKLEQRIGRLDRLGQTRDVLVYNFYVKNTVEGDVLRVLSERIKVFEETIGGLEPMLGEVARDVRQLFFVEDERKYNAQFRRLNEKLEERVSRFRDVERTLADFVMDKRSFQLKEASHLLEQKLAVSNEEVERFAKALLGREFPEVTLRQERAGGRRVVRLYFPHETWRRLELDQRDAPAGAASSYSQASGADGSVVVTGTFDLDHARENESVEFLALGHPVVTSLIRWASRREFGAEVTRMVVTREAVEEAWRTFPRKERDQKRGPKRDPDAPSPLGSSRSGWFLVFHVQYEGVYFEQRLFPVFLDDRLVFDDALGRAIFYHLRSRGGGRLQRARGPEGVSSLTSVVAAGEAAVRTLLEVKAKSLAPLNERLYRHEREKYLRIQAHLEAKLESELDHAKNLLRRARSRIPSERGLERLKSIPDLERREKRLAEVEKAKEEVSSLEGRIREIDQRLESARFDHEDRMARLERRRKMRFGVELMALAWIELE
ncbi:MAG: hypothetical protein Kow0069_19810 [Promethearchaeota archaeon]